MNTKKAIQQGFTMIELIVVIVILGILAATALPKFVDMSGDAKQAAVQGVAGALNSAMSINYSACVLRGQSTTAPTGASTATCVAVANCTDGATLLNGGLPAGYTITSGAIAAPSGTALTTCNVANSATAAASATFTGIHAGTTP